MILKQYVGNGDDKTDRLKLKEIKKQRDIERKVKTMNKYIYIYEEVKKNRELK